MKVSRLSREEVVRTSVRTMNLNADATDLLSVEGLCASIRRAASFLCPTTPRQLVDTVLDAVSPLDNVGSVTRDDVVDHLELLISNGDLLELRQYTQRVTRQIFLGPPSYVPKVSGNYLLLGVRPYGAPLVDDTLAAKLLHEGHVRTIKLDAATATNRLSAAGLHQVRLDQWLHCPRMQRPSTFLNEYRQRLSAAGPAGQVEGLTLIDPDSPVRYYRVRWRAPKVSDTGDYVARRPQAYGADLWCFIRMKDGAPTALIDLPIADPAAPGCNEAWHLQAALDAERGQPQICRITTARDAHTSRILELFAPVPGWVQRHLEIAGTPVQRSNGSLFSYQVSTLAVDKITQFLTDMLWLRIVQVGGTQ
jgi:hypothetical protein